MTIKHSPVKNILFILISLWFGGFSALAAVDYLTSSNPYKDTSFFFLSLMVAAFFLLLLIFAICRLTIHATILSFDHEYVTYHYSGLLSAATYCIPMQQISHARYSRDSQESEISLWMEEGFHDFAAFNHPRHKIYAYPDSQLIGIVFKRKRLKVLEDHGLNSLIYQYKYSSPSQSPTATPQSTTDSQSNSDSVFF
ncbi:MAG: hypothetical protein HXO86_07230 [Streptococcus cristatus]|uniref:hypothetical protein n=1 Tax=Streptococcus sanguinis TaxID=1305 RepID=UPI000F690901|nr:hypothetical protein [Streptococcus sanguinis]MBF1698613.1 hypothetical protein [Streptococcus cristatus]RSI17663.1 hypothetical protein D8886_05395 [Streptococcus sanguinis]